MLAATSRAAAYLIVVLIVTALSCLLSYAAADMQPGRAVPVRQSARYGRRPLPGCGYTDPAPAERHPPFPAILLDRGCCRKNSHECPETPTPRDRPGGKDRSDRSAAPPVDRKSTRLNSSHVRISYAVFCLKK